jgi:hypothetical protein
MPIKSTADACSKGPNAICIEPSRPNYSAAEFRILEMRLVVHEQREKKNDRKRNSEQPEQRASTETHVSLHVLVTAWITRDEGQSSTHETRYWVDPPSRSSAKSRNNADDLPAIRSPINCAAMKLNVMPLPP